MATLMVGPGQQYTTINAAVNASIKGDTVLVASGVYNDDFLTIRHNLTLYALNGQVFMTADKNAPNGKAIITEGGTGIAVTIRGFDISGAKVADNNGAAIRYEGGNLTLSHSYIHNNQEGILANPAIAGTGNIVIGNSEFDHNGDGSGFTHNIYVGDVKQFTINGSYIHDVVVGHEIKSRAETTIVTNNRIFDNTGSASYSIDLPNGGNATIKNNQIEQGAHTQNPFIIAYGEEGGLHTGTTVDIEGNTITNDHTSPSDFAVLNRSSLALPFINNKIFGLNANHLASGPLAASGTTFLAVHPKLNLNHLPLIANPLPPPVIPTAQIFQSSAVTPNDLTAAANVAPQQETAPPASSSTDLSALSVMDIPALFAAMLHS